MQAYSLYYVSLFFVHTLIYKEVFYKSPFNLDCIDYSHISVFDKFIFSAQNE